MHRTLLSVLIFLILSFSENIQNPEDIKAVGTGRGANRAEALINAKRDAIEKGIGTMLISQTEINNFMLQKDLIITKTMGTIKNYDIITEKQESDGNYYIKINAVLSKNQLHDDLAAFKILLESMNKPKVMVIINETNVGRNSPQNHAAENAIIQFLKTPYEFEVIDPSIALSIKQSQQKMTALLGDAVAAAQIGTRYGAEVIITGDAISSVAENLSYNLGGMNSVQADVNLRAINCTSARIIATASAHSAKVHLSPETAGIKAITDASKKASKQLVNRIIEDWNNQINNGIPISVMVKGVQNFRTKNNVLATLKMVKGVVSVYDRGWNGQSGLLNIDVQYKGNINGFCSKVDGYKLNMGGTLGVTGQEGNRVTLTIQPN